MTILPRNPILKDLNEKNRYLLDMRNQKWHYGACQLCRPYFRVGRRQAIIK